MHRLLPACLFYILSTVASTAATQPSVENTLLLEVEKFEALGPWQRTGDMIQSSNMAATALAGFRIQESGEYRVWTRSQDFTASQPGSRRFLIKINEESAARESGAHGHDGFYWESVGQFNLSSGVHLLEIEDTARFYGRLEAILITSADFDPNDIQRKQLNRFESPAVQAKRVDRTNTSQVLDLTDETKQLATISNDRVMFRFLSTRSEDGQVRVLREAVSLSSNAGDAAIELGVEPITLLSKSSTMTSFDAYFPTWKTNALTEWEIAGRRLKRPSDSRNPYVAGQLDYLYPVSVKLLSENAAELTYRSDLGIEAKAIWRLPAGSRMAKVSVKLNVEKTGFYSLGFGVGPSLPRESVAEVQLPPLYQFKRIPSSPVMITASETPHPLALVESTVGVTTGVVADPSTLSRDWANRENAGAGFSLLDPAGQVRPQIFTPILGGVGSKLNQGDVLDASWWVVASVIPWTEAMRESDEIVYQLSDYREPVTTSLTDQALNIVDLMKDDDASQWDTRLKGPANMESPNTVTHASPLTYFSIARLTRDESFFQARAQPTLEYLLSRPSAHFAITAEGNLYVSEVAANLSLDHVFYGSAVWQGIDELTAGLNPWLNDYIQIDGDPVKNRNNSREPYWSSLLSLYRLDPNQNSLDRVISEANSWLLRAFEVDTDTTKGLQPFYNVSFYPYWWDLLDLYQLTSDQRYLDAACRAAWFTVAGQWVTPPVGEANQTLYAGGKHKGSYLVWWKEDYRFRLGWPDMRDMHTESRVNITVELEQKQVPSWTVSQSGLGIEQPISYFTAANNFANIQLLSWAPNLLRLYGETGDEYWRTFARNGIIGRGASYPGYYLSDYIDLAQSADYPKSGPDLNSFYWHHVPVHLSMLVDFLFTDFEVRTQGEISFPYVKQQGYVWFTSRIYGGKPGRVFDDTECWAWLDRNKFRVESPKVDYLGASSRNKFHLMLLNQAKGDVVAPVSIDTAALGIPDGAEPMLRTDVGISELPPMINGRLQVELPKGGWAVISWPAKSEEFETQLSPLESTPVDIELGSKWGKAKLFRIRSPFGVDNVYAVLSAKMDSGVATFSVRREGQPVEVIQVESYPYELTISNVDPNEDLRINIQLYSDDVLEFQSGELVVPGD